MEQEYQNKHSFLKGAIVGFCLAAVLSILGFSVVTLANAKARQTISEKEEVESAKEVTINNRVLQKMEKIADLIDDQYIEDVDPEQLETYIYKGMMAGTGDLYSSYYSEDELEQFMEDSSGSYSGIGITMQYDSTRNQVKVVSINEEGPAAKVDIKEGDYIYKVDGEEVVLDNADMTELVSKVRGEEGTTVELTLQRGDDNEEIDVKVKRQNIEVATVKSQMLADKIGYIQITQFEGLTTDQFNEAYEQLKSDGAEGLILDLRDNPGGQVDSVCEIAQNFLPKGLVTYMEDKHGNRQDYTCSGKNIWDKPLVVLVNGNSASASEILSGAIRDYEVGTLLGTKTFGKGIVQQTIPLGDNTAIKITFAKYYTPNGENIHGEGIEPDIEVEYEQPDEDEEYDIEKDNQVLAAIENIKEQMNGR